MAAFSPDGNRIISVADSWAAVWDAKTGAAIAHTTARMRRIWHGRTSGPTLTLLSPFQKRELQEFGKCQVVGLVDAFRVACQKLGSTSSLGIISAKFGLADLKAYL